MAPINSVVDKIKYYIQIDAFIMIAILLFLGFVFYRLFLKEISEKRHLNLKMRFKSSLLFLSISALLSLIHWSTCDQFESALLIKISNYISFFSLITGAVAVVKIGQIGAYLYLFFKNIRQGIPRLIVNLLSVLFYLAVICFLASEIFAIQLTAMLATSAVFSLILGLALQDTLGNLFCGVAMEIGQPYKIGDWIEVHSSDSKKWIGQVQEITWRATFLSSFSDEWIMIPNKTIAQSQIIICSNNQSQLRHSQMFRLRLTENTDEVKKIILDAVQRVSGVLQNPEPRVLLIETTESWVALKVFYSIESFDLKYRIADQVISKVLNRFREVGIQLAVNRLSLDPKISSSENLMT